MDCLSSSLATGRNDGGDRDDKGCEGGSDNGTKARTGDGGSKDLDRALDANGYDSAN